MTTDDPRSERKFKKLPPKNWRERDGTADHIVSIRDGKAVSLDGDDWAATILGIELSPKAPAEVRDLFEVAQGALCYGWFFYPLYTVGSQQLYRVQEAALRHRCAALGAPKKVKTFLAMLEWLEQQGILPKSRLGQWDATRHLRNMSSHQEKQSIYDPIMAVSGLRTSVELINELFDTADGPNK